MTRSFDYVCDSGERRLPRHAQLCVFSF